MYKNLPPVLTIDGPSGSGKGTVSLKLAKRLGWNFLDSGLVYRALALAVIRTETDINDHQAILHLAKDLSLPAESSLPIGGNESKGITGQKKWDDELNELRSKQCSEMASKLGVYPEVRVALLDRQKAFLKPPGLVADGRDMGTVVFPNAILKIFLDATAAERAKRRYLQLKNQGVDVTLDVLIAELELRDTRDRQRKVAPLVPAADAIVIDTTGKKVEDICSIILSNLKDRLDDGPLS